MISDNALIDLVCERMKDNGISQIDLSRSTGVSQGHLSKALRKITPLGSTARTSLLKWLGGGTLVKEADIARNYLEQLIKMGDAGTAMAMHVLNGALTYARSLKPSPDLKH